MVANQFAIAIAVVLVLTQVEPVVTVSQLDGSSALCVGASNDTLAALAELSLGEGEAGRC